MTDGVSVGRAAIPGGSTEMTTKEVFFRVTTTEDEDVGFPASEIAFIKFMDDYTEVRIRGGERLFLDADAGDMMAELGAVRMGELP